MLRWQICVCFDAIIYAHHALLCVCAINVSVLPQHHVSDLTFLAPLPFMRVTSTNHPFDVSLEDLLPGFCMCAVYSCLGSIYRKRETEGVDNEFFVVAVLVPPLLKPIMNCYIQVSVGLLIICIEINGEMTILAYITRTL